MANVIIIYDSQTGNTEMMAKAVFEGTQEAGAETVLKKVDEVNMDEVEKADGVILGSPNYFGTMTAKMKKFIDDSVVLYMKEKLKGKVGATFVAAAGTGTGAETTTQSLVTAMVIHQMIIVSAPATVVGYPGTYGVMADGLGFENTPDEGVLKHCRALGKRVAEVAEKLS